MPDQFVRRPLRCFSLSVAVISSIALLAGGSPVKAQAPETEITLGEAVRQAIAVNPVTLAAAEQVKEARAALGGIEAQQRFQVTFNSAASVSNATVIQPPPGGETFGAWQNSLTVPIPVGSKNSYLIRQAESEVAQTGAAYQSSIITLAAKVGTAYINFLKEQAIVSAAKSELDESSREMADVQSRYRSGDVPQLEVEQAQVPVSVDQSALLQAQAGQTTAAETLNDLLGQPLDTPLSVEDIAGTPSGPGYSMDESRRLALLASPDVAADDDLVKADENALEAAKRYAEPQLSLQAIDIRSGDQTAFSREDTLQAAVTIPIADGGVGISAIKSATASLNQARFNADAARKAALLAVSTDYLAVQSSLAEIAAAKSAADVSQDTYQKTQLGYTNGLNSLVDVQSAANAAAQAQAAYIQSRYDSASNWLALNLDINGIAAITDKNTK